MILYVDNLEDDITDDLLLTFLKDVNIPVNDVSVVKDQEHAKHQFALSCSPEIAPLIMRLNRCCIYYRGMQITSADGMQRTSRTFFKSLVNEPGGPKPVPIESLLSLLKDGGTVVHSSTPGSAIGLTPEAVMTIYQNFGPILALVYPATQAKRGIWYIVYATETAADILLASPPLSLGGVTITWKKRNLTQLIDILNGSDGSG